MNATFFSTPEKFRAWLKKNHKKEKELLVGFYKVDSGKPSMTWSESVDQALCFGWIDGIRRSMGEESYSIRFTPRKPSSIWSAINIKKMDALRKAGLMLPEGEKAFEHRKEHLSKIYSYEKEAYVLGTDYEKRFKKNKLAWKFFNEQPPGYKKQMIHRIMSAKQEATQLSRLEKLMKTSEQGKRMS